MDKWNRRESNHMHAGGTLLPSTSRAPPSAYAIWMKRIRNVLLPSRRSTRRRLAILLYAVIIFVVWRRFSFGALKRFLLFGDGEEEYECVKGLEEPVDLLAIGRGGGGTIWYEFMEGAAPFEGRYVVYDHTTTTTTTDPEAHQPSSSSARESPPTSCLHEYFASGKPCSSSLNLRLDLVYAYVNGSDPLHHSFHRTALQREPPPNLLAKPPRSNILREFDELRFSLRSVLEGFRGGVGKVLLIGSEYPWPGCPTNAEGRGGGKWSLGQVPQWLSMEGTGTRDGEVELEVVHHSTLFGEGGAGDVYDWRRPTFNSLAIESRLAGLDGVSDNL